MEFRTPGFRFLLGLAVRLFLIFPAADLADAFLLLGCLVDFVARPDPRRFCCVVLEDRVREDFFFGMSKQPASEHDKGKTVAKSVFFERVSQFTQRVPQLVAKPTQTARKA